MEIRFASLRLGTSYDLPESERIVRVSCMGELLECGCNAFILEGSNARHAQEAAELIRGTPKTCLSPLFYTQPQGVRLGALADAHIQRLDDALLPAEEILSRLSEVNRASLAENADLRLLDWFYTRKERELLPVADPMTPGIYGYPLAECLSGGKMDVLQWLCNLESQKQIASGRLIDRIRVCPRCSSSHVNYVDVCPSCQSINTEKKEMIHCFTCGRVSTMEGALRENSMACPCCGTRLRHLGSDYDHPLDSTVCGDCGAHFIDPAIVAACYACGARSAPDELAVRSFRAYLITDKGRISARIGELDIAYDLFDRLGNANAAYFQQFLGWMMDFAKRYPDEAFSVVVLRFANMGAVADAIGSQRMTQMIDAMAARLKELLRGTDVTSRSEKGTLWFLLPRTPKDRGELVRKRIEDIRNLVELEGAPALEVRTELFAFPDDIGHGGFAETTSARGIILTLGHDVETV